MQFRPDARFFATSDVPRDNNSLAPCDDRVATTTISWKIIFRFARPYFRFDRYRIYLNSENYIFVAKIFSIFFDAVEIFFLFFHRILGEKGSPFKDSLLRRIIQIYARASKLSVAAFQRKSGIQVCPSSSVIKEKKERKRSGNGRDNLI